MKKSTHIITAAIVALGLSNAWADDKSADKPGMDMPQGEMKDGGMIDKDRMKKMHEHMNEMHKSKDTSKGDEMCDMKSDSKCAAKDMKSANKTTPDKVQAPANADDHAAHHQ